MSSRDCLDAPGLALGAFSFAVMIAYVPGWSGAATVPRWALLFAVVPAVAMFTQCYRFTIIHGLGVALLSYAALSLLWTPNGWDGLDALAKLLLLAALFHVGAALPSLKPVYVGAALGIWVNSAVVIAQIANGAEDPPFLASGLFFNRNYLVEPAALVLIGVVVHRLWWLVPGLLPSVLPLALLMPWNYGASARDLLALPQGRGALLALAAAGILALPGRTSRAIAALAALAALGLVALLATNASLPQRAIIWLSTLDGMTWWGNGLGSFYTLFPSHAPAWDFLVSRPVHAHNDFLELIYDLGLGGLPFLAVLAGAYVAPWRAEHFVLAGLMVEAAFGFPLHLPATVFVGGLVAGHACRECASLRDVLARGGMALCASMERGAARFGTRPQRQPRRFGIPARSPH